MTENKREKRDFLKQYILAASVGTAPNSVYSQTIIQRGLELWNLLNSNAPEDYEKQFNG